MFEIIKKNINIDFLSRVNLFFIVSGVLCIISLLLIFSKGFNYGIDFAGGTLVQVRFNQPPDLNDIRNDMEKLDIGDVDENSSVNSSFSNRAKRNLLSSIQPSPSPYRRQDSPLPKSVLDGQWDVIPPTPDIASSDILQRTTLNSKYFHPAEFPC